MNTICIINRINTYHFDSGEFYTAALKTTVHSDEFLRPAPSREIVTVIKKADVAKVVVSLYESVGLSPLINLFSPSSSLNY